MFTLFLMFILVACASTQYLDPGVQTQVLTAPYLNNLQPCFTWNSLNAGPVISDIATYCPGEVYLGCISAVNQNYFSIIAHGSLNDTLSLTANNTVTSPNGAPFFRTYNTFGIGSNTGITNCSFANDSNTLCWNVNASTNQIGVGGWCGAEGFQSQFSVFFYIASLPCLNSTVGSNCTVPGEGLCVTGATCGANYQCVGGVNVTAPVPNPDSCWTAPTCNPLTGTFPLVNSTVGTPCSTNNSCLQNMACNGLQQCVGGFSPCNSTTNVCLNQPVCVSYNASYYQCVYNPNNNTCYYDSGWRCRQGDQCVGGACIPGPPLTPPVLDVCQINATCDNSTGTFVFATLPDNTTCINVNNLCQHGGCLGGVCNNFVNNPSPFTNLSVCLVPVCSPNNGSWSTTPAGNPGASCALDDPCRRGLCLTNGSCIDFGPRTCPFYPTLPCINSTCIPFVGCVNMTINGTACDADACNIGGICWYGACLGTHPKNCNGTTLVNPVCSYAACNNLSGCVAAYYNSSVTCPNICFIGGSGNCLNGNCFGTPSGICGSAAAASLDWWVDV